MKNLKKKRFTDFLEHHTEEEFNNEVKGIKETIDLNENDLSFIFSVLLNYRTKVRERAFIDGYILGSEIQLRLMKKKTESLLNKALKQASKQWGEN